MKIIAGKYKGRNFYMPKHIRPTQNMTREAVFDIIGQDLSDSSFLELFAGSGAVSFEALSRNAAEVVLVEKDSKCLSVIDENLRLLGLKSYKDFGLDLQVLPLDAFVAIKKFAKQGKRFDIVFLDPPFGLGLAKKALKTLEGYDILQPNALVIIQYGKQETLPESLGRFLRVRQRKYGISFLDIFKAKTS